MRNENQPWVFLKTFLLVIGFIYGNCSKTILDWEHFHVKCFLFLFWNLELFLNHNLRNFPLIIRSFVINDDDIVLDFALKLHEIVERLCAPEFFLYEVKILEEKIIDYLDLRQKIRDEFQDLMPNAKPEHHFIRKHLLIFFQKYSFKTKKISWLIPVFELSPQSYVLCHLGYPLGVEGWL